MRFAPVWPIWFVLFVGISTLPFPLAGHAQEDLGKKEIISRSVEAMGGDDRIGALKTLRFTVVGSDGRALDWEILRPNRVRKERVGDLILAFDGKRAGFLQQRQDDGTMTGPRLVPEEDWHHFEMDIALHLPAFLDYPSEYLGLEAGDGGPVHLLRVELPMGGVVVYAIDATSFLLASIRFPDWGYERILGGFEEADGVLLPTRYWTASDPSAISTVKEVVVDLPLTEDRFTPREQGADPPDPAREGTSSWTPYLGQAPPGMTAELFAPGLVSTEDGELNSVFTPDLQEFYFTRRGVPSIPPRIMVTRRGEEGWSIPEAVDFGGRYSAIDLFLAPDGQRMVFCSDRPRPGEASARPDHDFWVSERDGEGWGAPRLFAPAALSDSEDFYPVVTESGNLYFNSQRAGPGTNNIFRSSRVDGEYVPAEKLPAPINSEHREFDAFVSSTEDMILFSSDRPGGFGRADIYVSFLTDGTWSEPRNLGSEVNSASSEYGAVLSPDGAYLYFTSSRSGSEDIYWISAEVIRRGGS